MQRIGMTTAAHGTAECLSLHIAHVTAELCSLIHLDVSALLDQYAGATDIFADPLCVTT